MFKALLNPWVLLGALVASLMLFAGGVKVGKDFSDASHARLEAKLDAVRETAQRAAAEEIAKIKIVNQTNRQVLERETRIVPDYSACHHSPDGLRAVNAALENRAVGAGDRELPEADAPR